MAPSENDQIKNVTKILRKGVADGARKEAESSNRATGTRLRYKAGYEACVAALAELGVKPGRPKGAASTLVRSSAAAKASVRARPKRAAAAK